MTDEQEQPADVQGCWECGIRPATRESLFSTALGCDECAPYWPRMVP